MWVEFLCCEWCFFLFFFKQKTAYEMRISDWSSDVCSSDLQQQFARRAVDVDRKRLAPLQRPGELGIDGEVEHSPARTLHDLGALEAIKAQQPVGLVKPVLAHQRRPHRRQVAARIGNRAVR